MLFVMNIGNTNTQTAFWDGTCLSGLKSCPTASLEASAVPRDMPAAAASVVPAMRRKLSPCGIFWLGPEMRTGLDTAVMDMNTVGADRLANAVYLAELANGRPAVCLDCGTAITLEIVDAEKRFLGGAIAPGRMLLRQSLNRHTAQLPLIPMYDEPPISGLNTPDAIRMGVDCGAIGIARELLARAGEVLGDKTMVTFGIGGDAGFFCRAIRGLVYGGDDFTLRGVVKSWEFNHL